MGRNHARVLRALPDVDLVGVTDAACDVRSSSDDLTMVPTIDELLQLGLDMCVVATTTATHEEIGARLAAASVATLIEKPVTQNVASAQRLVRRFEERGVLGCVGHIERYNPAMQHLRRRLAAGELGDLYQVTTRRQGPFPARVTDVGVILDLATHDIDLTAWMTGCAYRSIAAQTVHTNGRGTEDLVSAVGVLLGGTVVSHLVDWVSPSKERVTTVTGARGCFVADTLHAVLTYYEHATQVTRYPIPKVEPLVTELTAFARAARGEESDVVTLRQGLATVVVAEAMRRSARTGLTEMLDA